MSRTTTMTGVISIANKSISITEQIAIREQVNLHLTGYGTAGASDLALAIINDGVLVAWLTPLVDSTTYLSGVIDLNTEEIVAVFSGASANARVKMSIVVWDVTNNCCLANDWIWIQNNPFVTGMVEPAAIDPILSLTYALLANGVTNGDSHTHQSGDGASLDPYYVRRVTTGAFFRQSTDGLDIEVRDRVRNTWHTLILANGSLGIGPAI